AQAGTRVPPCVRAQPPLDRRPRVRVRDRALVRRGTPSRPPLRRHAGRPFSVPWQPGQVRNPLAMTVAWIEPGSGTLFPPVDQALREPDGLLAAGADLTPARLLDAYAHGI